MNRLRHGRNVVEEREYWLKKLSFQGQTGHPFTDHNRPSVFSTHTDSINVTLSADTLQRLTDLAGGSEFLIYTALLTALKICLYKYTGSRIISVGSPARKRADEVGIENALAIVDQLDESLTVKQLLLNVRETLLEAYARQRYPFAQILQDLGLDHITNKCPLFDFSLVFRSIHYSLPEVKSDLTITFTQSEGKLFGTADYKTAVFGKGTIVRFCDSFLYILQQLLADTSARIFNLAPLTPVERKYLIEEWNTRRIHNSNSVTLCELFESQVQRAPDSVSVSSSSGLHLTYSRLYESSSRLALDLISHSVGSESFVALLGDRSPETITCLLAILKAGGCYVPLDPASPTRRLSNLLDDLGHPTLLATVTVPESISFHCSEALRANDFRRGSGSVTEAGETTRETFSDNLAYVIYTSGSTGAPKGVMVSHRNACNLVLAQIEAFRIGPASRVLQFASLSFDASVSEVFTALCSGACLCLTGRENLIPGESLLELIRRESITTLTLPPTALLAMTEAEAPSLETLVSAGEVCTPELVKRWNAAGRLFLNAYGPTEASVCATVSSALNGDCERAPIGRPIMNATAYVVGPSGELLARGGVGELWVGGDGVTRGYLGNPAVTAEKFVPDGFGGIEGGRLYKTGDLCRFGAEGDLEYLRRIDQQAKIRGYRVEPGEVEQALRRQNGVKQAVVVTSRRAGSSEVELIGYVVLEEEERQGAKELRKQLAEELPEYMVPAKLIEVSVVPVTENGKVDRQRLADQWEEISAAKSAECGGIIETRKPIEEIVEGVWAEALGVERVRTDENFFELGGHSIIATQVISRISELLHVKIPLTLIFETANLRELAKSIATLMHGGRSLDDHPITRTRRDVPAPLSFAQQRLWIIDRMNPNNAAYNITASYRAKGRLNPTILEKSFNEIIRRHEVIRTGFPSRRGQPIQWILPTLHFTLPVEDLSEFSAEEKEKKIRADILQDASTPFDLARPPLMRARLLRLSEDEHVLVVVMHHIITDGWSLGIFVREMITLYEAFSKDAEPPLPDLKIQYADFAYWQRQWQIESLETQLSYWKRQLKGAPALLDLPTDHHRQARRSFDGARRRVRFSRNLREKLILLSRREGATLFMALLAGFKALLYRYTCQEDIVVGSPIANRQKVETENLIGFFVNTLALRTDLAGNPSVQELLRRVRAMALAAYAHQDMPFERLVEELRVERELSHTPLFQVLFTLQNADAPVLWLTDITFEALNFDNKTAQFDLTFSISETETGFDIFIEYSKCLFDQTTIINMADHFQTLLEGMAAHPEQSLTSLPLLSEPQRQMALIEWNDTFEPLSPENRIHLLCEAQSYRTSCSVALDCEEGQLTYAELDRRANQLARRLQEKGVCAEVLVGLYLPPGIDFVLAILGVLKAGGAYLPLDPAYPMERLDWMLKDAGATLILTNQSLMKRLGDRLPEIMRLDAERPTIATQSMAGVTSDVLPDNLAYVIYTSGSTGVPRGVMVTHRGVCNLISAQIRVFKISSASRVLQFASMSFDASVSEIFTALCSGACLCLRQKERLMPGQPLLKAIEEQAITTLTVPPTALRAMPAAESLCLQTLVSAGEACAPELVEKWSGGKRSLLNAYGPTEMSVCATISSRQSGGRARVPIGRPIRNTRTYVLGRRGALLPRGSVGELCVGGEGMARGYLGRPEQTAERFAPDPISVERGARLYLSGDLCRLNSGGELEYLGRIDQQVKVRGHRVEPAEVEKAIESHQEAKEAIVIAREDDQSGKNLVAYVAPVTGAKLGGTALRAFLRRKVPEYMAPSLFVFLDALPRLPNGKVDRSRLPEPKQTEPNLETSYVEPRTQTEISIMRIWRQVLQIEKIGTHNNFFELGGNSLQLVQMLDQLQEFFQTELSIVELFTYPTIRTLADYLTEDRGVSPSLQPAYDRANLRKANPITREHIRRVANQKATMNNRGLDE